MIHIRPSTAQDMTAIDAMLSRSYPKLLKADYPPSVLVTVLPLISRAQPALVGCGTYYVAVDRTAGIVGAGGWTRDKQRNDLGHVRHVVTDDRHLRRGIARALLSHSVSEARTAGIRELECWSTRTGVPFYTDIGFETVGPIDVPLRPGISLPSIRMTLRID